MTTTPDREALAKIAQIILKYFTGEQMARECAKDVMAILPQDAREQAAKTNPGAGAEPATEANHILAMRAASDAASRIDSLIARLKLAEVIEGGCVRLDQDATAAFRRLLEIAAVFSTVTDRYAIRIDDLEREKIALIDDNKRMREALEAQGCGPALAALKKLLPGKPQWTVAEIRTQMLGRPGTPKDIYNALGYLVRTGKLKSIGYGKYEVTSAAPVQQER